MNNKAIIRKIYQNTIAMQAIMILLKLTLFKDMAYFWALLPLNILSMLIIIPTVLGLVLIVLEALQARKLAAREKKAQSSRTRRKHDSSDTESVGTKVDYSSKKSTKLKKL